MAPDTRMDDATQPALEESKVEPGASWRDAETQVIPKNNLWLVRVISTSEEPYSLLD